MSTRVLVVDDSAVARQVISEALTGDTTIEVVGVASSTSAALLRMQRLKPDVITLDVNMAPLDGISFLRQYMASTPMPTVIVSSKGQRGSQESVAALMAGAVYVVPKPAGWEPHGMEEFRKLLCRSVKRAAKTVVRRVTSNEPSRATTISSTVPAKRAKPTTTSPDIIGIGVSTGGAAALNQILPQFPVDAPPIVIVDHMPPGFTKEFAESVNARCPTHVCEAVDGQPLSAGQIVIAPGGDRHTQVERTRDGGFVVRLVCGDPVGGHRPSVTVLFRSLTKTVGATVAAAILTGMGRDGAEGLLGLRRAGAFTIAQDEASCVVYGMPKAAIGLGAVVASVPLSSIPRRLLDGC